MSSLNDLIHALQKELKSEKLFVADVGSTGGVEEKWRPYLKSCHFYTFDPDPRAKKWEISSTNFPIGLWSKNCHKTLILKEYAPASSLFEINEKELGDFGFGDFFKTVGLKEIALDSLDHLLENQPLDFLKVDAEGAELAILQGAEKKLENVLGLQLEVFFLPVRKEAPLFGDIEQFLRKKGFFAYQLNREHWIRKNKTYSYKSYPQLIWANALFLPSKERLNELLNKGGRPLFFKFLLILLTYQLYDYAYELCEEREERELCLLIKKSCKTSPLIAAELLLSLCLGSLKFFFAFSREKKNHRVSYLKRKMRELGSFCLSYGKNNFAVYDE